VPWAEQSGSGSLQLRPGRVKQLYQAQLQTHKEVAFSVDGSNEGVGTFFWMAPEWRQLIFS
jgi:hypothetical protein